MAFLRLEYEKRPLSEEETPQNFFDHVEGSHACLIESGRDGRYSYIAYDPFMVVRKRGETTHVTQLKNFLDERKGKERIIEEGGEWPVLEMLRKYELKERGPVPFAGGAAGYMSYDYGCGFMGVSQKVFDDAKIPDYMFGFYDKVIAFDHKERVIYFLALAETDIAARRKSKEIHEDLENGTPLRRKGAVGHLRSNLSREAYARKLQQIFNFLRSGDTYQVNFSQRFSAECTVHPWTLYKKLSQKNPAPFACFFEYPDFSIVSCSPELLLRKRGAKIETWPIKGTVARGSSAAQDQIQKKKLLDSEKDEAELSMIVDLERNDLGKVCKPGSVMIEAHREMLTASHVFHTVSRVRGELEKGKTVFDCLRALFPGGSITGCPKKRTMEIIDHLEDYKRGVYTGSAGFMSFAGDGAAGDCDFNILIRTMLLRDDKVFFHAGGGIVIDSDPAQEYQETIDKIEALRAALD